MGSKRTYGTVLDNEDLDLGALDPQDVSESADDEQTDFDNDELSFDESDPDLALDNEPSDEQDESDEQESDDEDDDDSSDNDNETVADKAAAKAARDAAREARKLAAKVAFDNITQPLLVGGKSADVPDDNVKACAEAFAGVPGGRQYLTQLSMQLQRDQLDNDDLDTRQLTKLVIRIETLVPDKAPSVRADALTPADRAKLRANLTHSLIVSLKGLIDKASTQLAGVENLPDNYEPVLVELSSPVVNKISELSERMAKFGLALDNGDKVAAGTRTDSNVKSFKSDFVPGATLYHIAKGRVTATLTIDNGGRWSVKLDNGNALAVDNPTPSGAQKAVVGPKGAPQSGYVYWANQAYYDKVIAKG